MNRPETVHSYRPAIPRRVDREQLISEVARFFGAEVGRVRELYRVYRALHEKKGYARSLGERKTLCFEEAFLVLVILAAPPLRTRKLVPPKRNDHRAGHAIRRPATESQARPSKTQRSSSWARNPAPRLGGSLTSSTSFAWKAG